MALQFPCETCGSMITIKFCSHGDEVVCKSCGSANIIPAEAPEIEISDTSRPVGVKEPTAKKPDPQILLVETAESAERIVATVDGAPRTLVLTPDTVVYPIKSVHAGVYTLHWELPLMSPRARFLLNPAEGSVNLAYNISASGIKFPDCCCACMAPPVKYDLFEVYSKAEDVPDAQCAEIADMSKAEQANHAIGHHRFWHAVPFCDQHSMASRALKVDPEVLLPLENRPVTLQFGNREYARSFAQANDVQGFWETPKAMKIRSLGWLGWAPLYFAAFIGAIFILRSLMGGFGDTPSRPTDILYGIPLFIGGLVLGVYVTKIWRKHIKGEPL